MRWNPFFSQPAAGESGAPGRPAPDVRAARARKQRSGGRREVDRSLRQALLELLSDDREQAEKLVARAVEIDSDAIDAYLALARLYRAKGELGRSIRIHQNLLMRSDLAGDERNVSLLELARDFHEGGFCERAIAAYEEVLEFDRKNTVALAGVAELSEQRGDYPRALEFQKRLAKLQGGADAGEAARLLVCMAQAEHDEGRSDAARKLLKKARKRDPKNAAAPALLGEIEAERGKNKAALAAWSAAVKLGGSVAAQIHPKLEATFAALDKTQGYETFLRELLAANEADTTARLVLARTLSRRGEVDPAISELRKLLDREPANLDARIALGQLLLAEHRETDAAKEFGELLSVLETSRAAIPSPPAEPLE